VEPDVMIKGFLKDDVILMTTDGLTNLVSKDDLYNTVKNENLEQVPKKLVEKAIENGGYDNITVIIIKNI
jgi:protein phosphatase